MNLTKLIIKRKWLVIIIWIIIILSFTPALLNYSHYISYRNEGSLPSNSESAQAQSILQNYSKDNSTVIIAINSNILSNITADTQIMNMQNEIMHSGIKNLSSTSSAVSEYISFIDSISYSNKEEISSIYNGTIQNISFMYTYPHSFYQAFSSFNFSVKRISEAINSSGYNNSQYEKEFLFNLNKTVSNYSKNGYVNDPIIWIQKSIETSFNQVYPKYVISVYNPSSFIAFNYYSVINFTKNVSPAVSSFFSSYFHVNVWPDLITSISLSSNPGIYYVDNFGLYRLPSFIREQYISPSGNVTVFDVIFNVPSGYIGPGDYVPSQVATPVIENIAEKFFGSKSYVTGNGPIEYETQQITSKDAFVFGILFVVLALAVGITLFSWRAGIISIIFVSLATVLGYVSIFITGLLVHSVNYIVNYTLTAVALGVSTDYLIFIASRYRQEIKEGSDKEQALQNAIGKAGRAVVISGITVAFSLAMFSFIPGFLSWGITLLIAIILIMIMVTTLFSAILSVAGTKLFGKSSLKPYKKDYLESSRFHSIAKSSINHKFTIAFVIIILALPSVYFFATVPSTYNFNSGLPNSLEAVKGLNIIENSFGANVIYPNFVLIKAPYNVWKNNSTNDAILKSDTSYILSVEGVSKVIGPYSNGTALNNNLSLSTYTIGNDKYIEYVVYYNYNPYSSNAIQTTEKLRENKNFIVGGITSSLIDQKKVNSVIYPELEVLIASVIFVIFTIAFSSLKYPLTAISGVIISISWTTVILYFISNYILHEELIYLITPILFIILMSLGSDYSTFIISRIKEYRKRENFETGAPKAFSSSGRVITSLGLILAASLGSLGFIQDPFLEQLGISFVISLLIDTFIIRTIYFPSILAIFERYRKKN